MLPPHDRAVPGRDRADSARQLEGDRAAQGRGDSRRAVARRACASSSTTDEENSPGWKFAEWELRGVPLRLEIGPKDIEKAQVFSRAATRARRPRSRWPVSATRVPALLEEIQRRCSRARWRSARSTRREASTCDEFKSAMEGRPGFVIARWCGSAECEAAIKAETQATLRNIPLGSPRVDGPVRQVQRRRAGEGVVREGVLTSRRDPERVGSNRRLASMVQRLSSRHIPGLSATSV